MEQSSFVWQEAYESDSATGHDLIGDPVEKRRPESENAAASLHKGNRIVVTGRLEQRSYETREGEKRNVTEVIADDLGPSLRWAQAQVERISRDSADGGGFSGGGSGSGGGAPKPASDPIYGDEEPF